MDEFNKIMQDAIKLKTAQVAEDRTVFDSLPGYTRNTLFHPPETTSCRWTLAAAAAGMETAAASSSSSSSSSTTGEVSSHASLLLKRQQLDRARTYAKTMSDVGKEHFTRREYVEAISVYERAIGVFTFVQWKNVGKDAESGSRSSIRDQDVDIVRIAKLFEAVKLMNAHLEAEEGGQVDGGETKPDDDPTGDQYGLVDIDALRTEIAALMVNFSLAASKLVQQWDEGNKGAAEREQEDNAWRHSGAATATEEADATEEQKGGETAKGDDEEGKDPNLFIHSREYIEDTRRLAFDAVDSVLEDFYPGHLKAGYRWALCKSQGPGAGHKEVEEAVSTLKDVIATHKQNVKVREKQRKLQQKRMQEQGPGEVDKEKEMKKKEREMVQIIALEQQQLQEAMLLVQTLQAELKSLNRKGRKMMSAALSTSASPPSAPNTASPTAANGTSAQSSSATTTTSGSVEDRQLIEQQKRKEEEQQKKKNKQQQQQLERFYSQFNAGWTGLLHAQRAERQELNNSELSDNNNNRNNNASSSNKLSDAVVQLVVGVAEFVCQHFLVPARCYHPVFLTEKGITGTSSAPAPTASSHHQTNAESSLSRDHLQQARHAIQRCGFALEVFDRNYDDFFCRRHQQQTHKNLSMVEEKNDDIDTFIEALKQTNDKINFDNSIVQVDNRFWIKEDLLFSSVVVLLSVSVSMSSTDSVAGKRNEGNENSLQQTPKKGFGWLPLSVDVGGKKNLLRLPQTLVRSLLSTASDQSVSEMKGAIDGGAKNAAEGLLLRDGTGDVMRTGDILAEAMAYHCCSSVGSGDGKRRSKDDEVEVPGVDGQHTHTNTRDNSTQREECSDVSERTSSVFPASAISKLQIFLAQLLRLVPGKADTNDTAATSVDVRSFLYRTVIEERWRRWY